MAQRAGVIVSDTIPDMSTATLAVTANSRNSRPTMPLIMSSERAVHDSAFLSAFWFTLEYTALITPILCLLIFGIIVLQPKQEPENETPASDNAGPLGVKPVTV